MDPLAFGTDLTNTLIGEMKRGDWEVPNFTALGIGHEVRKRARNQGLSAEEQMQALRGSTNVMQNQLGLWR